MSNTYELIQQIRDELPEDSDVVGLTAETGHSGTITFKKLLRIMNRVQGDIQSLFLSHDDTLFMTYATANTVAEQDSYQIPSNCFAKRVRYLERKNDNGNWIVYYPTDLTDRDQYESDTLINWLITRYGVSGYRFYLLDDEIWPLPEITVSGTANLRIHFTKRLANFDFNIVAASGNNSLTLGTTAKAEADYYNNFDVAIVGTGAAADQVRTILDYSAARVCTVATWTNNPAVTDYYAIKCELGVEFENLLVSRCQAICFRILNLMDQSKSKWEEYNRILLERINALKDGRLGGPHYMKSTGLNE